MRIVFVSIFNTVCVWHLAPLSPYRLVDGLHKLVQIGRIVAIIVEPMQEEGGETVLQVLFFLGG